MYWALISSSLPIKVIELFWVSPFWLMSFALSANTTSFPINVIPLLALIVPRLTIFPLLGLNTGEKDSTNLVWVLKLLSVVLSIVLLATNLFALILAFCPINTPLGLTK